MVTCAEKVTVTAACSGHTRASLRRERYCLCDFLGLMMWL